MKPAFERDLEREIARGLVSALERALATGGGLEELRAARDAAQLLGLPGLDRLIAALAPHSARAWPVEIRPVVDRLTRVSARATTEGLAEFRRADADFNALAGEIVAMEWTSLPSRTGVIGAPVPTIGAAEVLNELPLEDPESLAVARRVRLTVPVAAATRAALDWLSGREGARRPLVLREDTSVLEIECHLRDAAGVPPAHEVLSGVGANLGPPISQAGDTRVGAWVLRVPAFSARRAYVMVEQGSLRLAVPWHAVLKLQVVRRDVIAQHASRIGMDVLPTLSPLAARGGESPVLTVAHGLKRGWMVADRLVWRLPADACEPDRRMIRAGLTRAVATDDGEVFGLAEPRLLLAATPMPPFPRVEEAQTKAAPPRPMESSAPAGEAAETAPAPAHEPAPGPAAATVKPEILDERWVTPLPAVADPPKAPAPVSETAPAMRGLGRVLVAEDSITARVFLTRLVEQLGFEVVAVERAAELRAELAAGPWSLVCVDVELPDARGTTWLREVRGLLPEDAALVALARDDHDIVTARMAGVWRTLLKPVEPGALRRLIARLGLAERASG